MTSDAQSTLSLRSELEDFLFYEAELLDARRFGDWLELFTHDAVYEMPLRVTRESQADWESSPRGRIFHDTRQTLGIRIERLTTDFAWAEQPASRTRRFVSNVRVTNDPDGAVAATCNLLVYRNRGDSTGHELYSACRRDVLRTTDQGWRIAKRWVQLDQSNVAGCNLPIFF